MASFSDSVFNKGELFCFQDVKVISGVFLLLCPFILKIFGLTLNNMNYG